MGPSGSTDDAEEPPVARRLLDTLERLLTLPGADLKRTLSHATNLVAEATSADKVDAFLYDSTRDSLVAVGTSDQPLSAKQRRLGLDVLPVSNGGRVVDVYQTGRTFVTGRLDQDVDELRGIKEGLGVRSQIGVPLVVAGSQRGMMMLASLTPDYFSPDDVRFAEAVARWTAIAAHRAELVEAISRNAAEQGRRAAAEELITILAHDLRNLLAPLDMRLHVLQRRAERETRDEDLGDLNAAQRALGRLRSLTTDILDVARIDQGLFHGIPERIDLAAVMDDTAKTLTSPSHPVQVRMATTTALFVAGEEARLRQCVENLILNAIQKSPKDAPVDVLVSSETRERREWARVEIIDQGPGIPEDLRPHIFERYTTGKRKEGGLGLGLYLAKQIAVMHAGDLTVDSTPGTGARFILGLPCYPND
jgi:two-component system, OmpR family, sensor kinase